MKNLKISLSISFLMMVNMLYAQYNLSDGFLIDKSFAFDRILKVTDENIYASFIQDKGASTTTMGSGKLAEKLSNVHKIVKLDRSFNMLKFYQTSKVENVFFHGDVMYITSSVLAINENICSFEVKKIDLNTMELIEKVTIDKEENQKIGWYGNAANMYQGGFYSSLSNDAKNILVTFKAFHKDDMFIRLKVYDLDFKLVKEIDKIDMIAKDARANFAMFSSNYGRYGTPYQLLANGDILSINSDSVLTIRSGNNVQETLLPFHKMDEGFEYVSILHTIEKDKMKVSGFIKGKGSGNGHDIKQLAYYEVNLNDYSVSNKSTIDVNSQFFKKVFLPYQWSDVDWRYIHILPDGKILLMFEEADVIYEKYKGASVMMFDVNKNAKLWEIPLHVKQKREAIGINYLGVKIAVNDKIMFAYNDLVKNIPMIGTEKSAQANLDVWRKDPEKGQPVFIYVDQNTGKADYSAPANLRGVPLFSTAGSGDIKINYFLSITANKEISKKEAIYKFLYW